jgi:hypothetical protein
MAGTYAKYSSVSGGGGGGGGITSINGNSNAAQTISGGSNITVSSSGGTTTISETAAGANTALSNLTSPTAINEPLLFSGGSIPIALGSVDPGTYFSYPAAGNLILSSTSDASKGYVAISDESMFLLGDANALTQGIAQTFAADSLAPGIFYMAIDGAGTLANIVDNFVELDGYGAGLSIAFGYASGTVASPGYASAFTGLGAFFFQTWNGISPSDNLVAVIKAGSTENHSSSSLGTNLTFESVNNGTTTRVSSLILSGNSVTIGPSGAAGLHQLNTAVSIPAAGVGTITNLPTGASGNPSTYIQITVNGTTIVIPGWVL